MALGLNYPGTVSTQQTFQVYPLYSSTIKGNFNWEHPSFLQLWQYRPRSSAGRGGETGTQEGKGVLLSSGPILVSFKS